MAGGLELAPLITKLKVDTEQFKKDMKKAAELGKEEAEKVQKSLKGLTKVGEKLGKVGNTLTKSVTVPVAGLGVATTKMAVDFESSFAKVSTLLYDSVVDFDNYKDALIEGSNDTKVAVDEYSEAVYSAISAGVDQTKAVEFTTEAMKLAKGGFTSGASAIDILTTAINGYNLSAKDATKLSDMLITTQNLGKTTVDELSQSMGKVIPIASSVNFSMNELSASYAQLTKNGIATAEAGTYMKQMLSELGKTGSVTDEALKELTEKGFAELKKEGFSTSEILKMLSQYAEEDGKTLKDMFSSVEAGSAALVLAKGNGEEYNEMLSAMNQSAGATQEAFDKIDATPAEQLAGALNELKNAGIKFGASFVPILTKVTDAIGKAADYFNEMSEAERENVIQMLAVTAAVGPMLKVVGGGISTYTKLSVAMSATTTTLGSMEGVGLIGGMANLSAICAPLVAGVAAVGTGIYVLHENSQLMSRSVIEASEDMSWMEKVLAKLNGVQIRTREELEEMGAVQKEFSEDISEEFQKAVEDSTGKLQEFSVFLREIGFDDVITREESDEFNQRISDMCSEAISTIQSKKDESQQALKELFAADDSIVDESEQKVLDILSASSNKQIEEIQVLKNKIIEIKQDALDEGRAMNEQEIAAVEEKVNKIKNIELQALGGTQEEIIYAKKDFSARVQTLNAEAASELLQEKAKARDEEIIQIQAAYDTQIEMLKAHLEDCTEEEKKELEAQITNLEADKQEKIRIQNELYGEYINIVNEKNPELVNLINQYNGEILKNEDIKMNERLLRMKECYNGLDKITSDGYYEMYNNTTRTMDLLAIDVDEATNDIIGMFGVYTMEVGAYTQQTADDVSKMAVEYDGSFETIVGANMKYEESTGNLVDSNGNVISSMKEVKSATDGTKNGIVAINGTPYDIEVDKDGTITALKDISLEADNATRARTLFISVVGKGSSSVGSIINNAVAQINTSRHFNGLDSVPYDGYQAVLHKGERVLTAEENKSYSTSPAVDYNAIQKIIRNEVSAIVIQVNGREFGRAVRSVK